MSTQIAVVRSNPVSQVSSRPAGDDCTLHERVNACGNNARKLSAPNQADEVIQRFRGFSELQPENALANYYYPMSLWKGKRAEDPDLNIQQVRSLLQKSISLDPKLAEAHVQLGNLYSDQRDYALSIVEYVRALDLNQNLPDAHYRLGQDYVHTGQKERAQQEFEVYQRLRAQHMAEVDKEKAEVQQFVYSAKAAPSTKP